jgi:ubiquinone/menaquinone biosynthesis C-methylase UbiE
MSKNEALERSYRNPLIGYGYDALSWLVYRPLGGRDELRERALDVAEVRRGERVLELGCGTGGLTRKLLERGTSVTAVDWSEPMLRSARRRAPGARFVRSEITAYAPNAEYDLVLLAFVLHEVSLEDRALALGVARRALAKGGRVAVVDHAEPSDGYLPKAVFKFVRAFEPPALADWARGSFEPEIERAGFEITQRATLARGIARAVVGG